MDSGTSLLLAVDGGQTSTKALLARLDGEVLGQGLGGPLSHVHGPGGAAKARAAIQGAIRSAYSAAGLDPGAVAAVALGLTGVDPAAPEASVMRGIVGAVVSPARLALFPDYVSNLAGASAGEPGVVVIAGGGSIAYGVTADGRDALAGGFGYLLGDEGSAFDIGRQAVVAAARASEGRGEPTALEGLVKQAFGVAELRQVRRVVYSADFSRDRLAALAPAVARAAEAGDVVSRRIVTGAGQELALTALAVVRQLHAPGTPVPIYPTGGVFRAGELVQAPFRGTLQAGWPAAEVRPACFPPVVGALIQARRACGLPADPPWLARVRAGAGVPRPAHPPGGGR